LGDTVKVPTFWEDEPRLVIPAGTQSHEIFEITGHGLPIYGRKNEKGNLFVRVIIQTPKKISAEEREVLEKLSELQDERILKGHRGLFERVSEGLSNLKRDIMGD
jgi:DnaJ-class molecular chaperone